RARHRLASALAGDRLAQRPAERLEAGLGLVMVVVALDPDMDRRAERIGEGAEDVAGHLGRIGADMAGFERALETAEGSAAEVDQDMRLGLVHRQREAEAAGARAGVRGPLPDPGAA